MQTNITKAMNYLNRGEFDSALNIFKQLTSLQAKNPQLWHFRAVSERKLGLLKASEKHFQKALKLAPNQAEIINAYGNLLSQLEKKEMAKQQFKKAIKINPNYIDPYLNLGNNLLKEASYEGAKNAYTQVLTLNKENTNAKVGLAKCLNKTNDIESAKNILIEALKSKPDNVQCLHLLGQIEKEQGNITNAKEHFNLILKQPGLHIETNKALASCFLIERNIEASVNKYEKIVRNAPLDFDAHSQLSLIKWSKSLPLNECFSNYDNAIEETKSTALMGQLGNKLLQAKEYRKAIEIADKILLISGSDAAAYIIKSNSLRELGEFEEAILTSSQGLKKNNKDLGLLYENGHAYIANSNAVEALKIFDQLCKYNQHNLSCVTLKSTSLKMLGKIKEYNELCDPNKFIYVSEITPPHESNSLSDFNLKLNNELVLLHSSKQHPLDQSLINGTQTIGDLFPSREHFINLLDIEINHHVLQYINSFAKTKRHPFLKRLTKNYRYQGSWSVLLQQQGFHKNHYHSEGWISGPYYNQIPSAVEKNGEGWIEFGIPEFNMRDKLEADYIVKPQDGLLVLFPSYFWHGTRAFTSDETRTTVAFDVVPQ